MDVYDSLVYIRDDFPKLFHHIYLFGSSLYVNVPEDIDVLLIHNDQLDVRHIIAERRRVLDLLQATFDGVIIHLTTMSNAELSDTGILDRFHCREITRNSP